MPRPHRVDPSSSRSTAMPIFTYLAVAGSMLIALLFVADAMREKSTPAVVTNVQPTQNLARVPAPEAQSAPEDLAKVESIAQEERAEEPPKKKRVTPAGTGDRTTLGREADTTEWPGIMNPKRVFLLRSKSLV